MLQIQHYGSLDQHANVRYQQQLEYCAASGYLAVNAVDTETPRAL